ncbi:hypothetical protein LMG28614_03687 [Paraburkholderia ultramafica]|uniref:GDT1 family protein n=1 Tax=Paraburkholderia ultramafica TaxID=1544867 RepID=A0A6S7BAE0_9BURK|nr:TMEM165/GDT1 family protein [Paraburkholderia ultramafica]CAB3793283.1 hypothetical protein LMG28614_03687 [Paraburkholderia ultramafica]
MIQVFFTSYLVVLLAELVGDKLLFTTGILATRYRASPILIGVVTAFALKMLVAVWFGYLILRLAGWIIATLSALTFISTAIILWKEKLPSEEPIVVPTTVPSFLRSAVVSFSAVFFAEWGDAGQLAAAGLAATYRSFLVVWLAAMLAMITKTLFAAGVGTGLRHRLPQTLMRYGGTATMLVLAVMAAFRVD